MYVHVLIHLLYHHFIYVPDGRKRTRLGASGGAFVALSRREVRTEYVERPFQVRQAFADLGAFPSCFGEARVDPVIEPTEPGNHGCGGGDTDGDDSDQHCDPFNRQRDPLPKQLSRRWEERRAAFEEVLRADLLVPDEATIMAVSLDGVRQAKRAAARAEGRPTKGPAGYREVGCGTVSFYDCDGERLGTLRMGRMPETKKATLKEMLSAEVEAALDYAGAAARGLPIGSRLSREPVAIW